MDLLKELEAKKERLRLLREKRKQTNIDYGIDSNLNDTEKASQETSNRPIFNMVNVATQTEELRASPEGTELKNSLPPMQPQQNKRNVITYNHGVQTDPVVYHYDPSLQNEVLDRELDAKNSPEETRSNASQEEYPSLFEFPDLKPLVISTGYGATESTRVETFSSRWYSNGENVNQLQYKTNAPDETKTLHLHSFHNHDIDDSQSVICQSFDYDSNRHITIVSFGVKENNSTVTIPKSYTYVIDTFTDKIIDKIELLGQIITRSIILRKFETHDIISTLSLTQRGKILLYELQKYSHDKLTKWNRNVITKNYHLGCEYLTGIWESKFKIVTGDSKGFISILNSLDLSQDKAFCIENQNRDIVTSQTIQVIPPSTNVLHTTEEKEYMVQTFIDEYLSKLLTFNEVNITTLVGSPFNDECLFLGTEDGGIYKVLLSDLGKNNGKITLDLENNGFLPTIQKHFNGNYLKENKSNEQQYNKTIFHNGYITGLSMESNGLLLSGSVDWTVKLWDTKDNKQLDMIDLQKPILSVNWITDNSNKNLFEDKYICYAVTWNTIYIIQWFINETYDAEEDKKDRKHFHRKQSATILMKFTIDQLNLSMKEFTVCKLVIDEKVKSKVSAILILGGDSSTIEYVQVVIEPR